MMPTSHPPAVDSEPGQRPGVPMEVPAEPRPGSHWEAPEPQRPSIPVLHSTTKRDLPAVFGTGQPPKGLSGRLRRIAYRIPEHRARHWMMLLLADRVDVLEHRFAARGGGSGGRESKLKTAAKAGASGAFGAMAMTGMRLVTTQLGLVEQVPPEAITQQKLGHLVARLPRRARKIVVELFHWTYGALGGSAFGLLPRSIQRRRWSGPAWGLLTWAAFEGVLAPALGLSQAKRARPVERLTLAADHLLYGVMVSGNRWARPV